MKSSAGKCRSARYRVPRIQGAHTKRDVVIRSPHGGDHTRVTDPDHSVSQRNQSDISFV